MSISALKIDGYYLIKYNIESYGIIRTCNSAIKHKRRDKVWRKYYNYCLRSTTQFELDYKVLQLFGERAGC